MEQLRKQAKELLRAHRAGAPEAVARVAAHDPGEPLKLSGAQHVVAREHGFPSWPRLKAYVERVAAHGPDLQHAFHEDLDYYEGRANGLLHRAQDGTRGASPRSSARRAADRGGRARRRRAPARLRELGGAAPPRRDLRDSGEPFARAYRAVEAHDVDGLRAQLEPFPELVAAVGTNGNDLLGMAGATCDERLVRVLLDAGADPTRGNAHGWTPLHQAGLLEPARCWRGCCSTTARPSTSRRAATAARRSSSALFWGHREVTERAGRARRAPAQPARRRRARTPRPRRGARRARRRLRRRRARTRLLPPARRVPGLAGVR